MCELCDIDGCDCSDQPVNWSSVDDVDSSGVPVSANGVAPTVADAEGLDSTLSWSGTTVTFAFPAAAEDFSIGSYYSAYNEPGSMLALSDFGKDVLREAFAYWDDLIGLNIVEADAGDLAQISVGASTAPSTAWAYYPGSFTANGDIWLNTSAWYLDALSSPEEPVIGSYAYATSMHEIGHALGLKHAHQASTGNSTVLDEAYDALEYTIMSYRSFAGAGTGGYTVETWGYPQSPMMLDIAMIQQIYGADFTTLSGDTTYTVSATTGEFFIDGVSQGVPGANRVFRTLWDGDGEDHIDLSNYTTDLLINLTPGEGIDLDVNSTAQTSRLGTNDDGDTVYAGYNIYMSLLYENDTRSLIENATGGTGNDTLIGNDADNTLTGGGGNDTFIGGLGADLLVLGTGMDTVSGTLAELDGDTIFGFDATYDQIKIENATLGMVTALVSNGQLILTNGTETATLELNGLTDEFDVIELAQQNTAVGLVFQNSSAPVAPESPVVEAETLLTDSIAAYTAAGLTVVTASDAGETINGSGDGSVLQGGLGDDRLREDAGNDVMYGGDGA
ncbi:M10 family metallopeptidase, partial [Meridianimarinicoccus aquatilis]